MAARVAVVSERLDAALGRAEEDGSSGGSQIQLSVLTPGLEQQEREVSVGCLAYAAERGRIE